MASYRVVLTSSAARELKRLSRQLNERIVPRLENLGSNPRPPGCKQTHRWAQRVAYSCGRLSRGIRHRPRSLAGRGDSDSSSKRSLRWMIAPVGVSAVPCERSRSTARRLALFIRTQCPEPLTPNIWHLTPKACPLTRVHASDERPRCLCPSTSLRAPRAEAEGWTARLCGTGLVLVSFATGTCHWF